MNIIRKQNREPTINIEFTKSEFDEILSVLSCEIDRCSMCTMSQATAAKGAIALLNALDEIDWNRHD
jgi:hypothetical protein